MNCTKGFRKNAVWIDFFERENASWDHLSYFLEPYSYLLNFEERDLEELYKEFIDFRTIQLADVKFHEEVLVCHYKDGSKENNMDTI